MIPPHRAVQELTPLMLAATVPYIYALRQNRANTLPQLCEEVDFAVEATSEQVMAMALAETLGVDPPEEYIPKTEGVPYTVIMHDDVNETLFPIGPFDPRIPREVATLSARQIIHAWFN